jgi:ubiquinone/menaquinone biosynthesis C-methylase UbiE
VVESTALEKRQGRKFLGSSNLPLSAVMEQKEKIILRYNKIASVYKDFQNAAHYKVPEFLQKIYEEKSIHGGSVLDVGCGSGELRDTLPNEFIIDGVDISPEMTKIAAQRYRRAWTGDALPILKKIPDKSYDHITALSWLYFLDPSEFPLVISEFERIAKRSIFLTCEQPDDETIQDMLNDEFKMQIWRHQIAEPGWEKKHELLWTRPSNKKEIYGDYYFKSL